MPAMAAAQRRSFTQLGSAAWRGIGIAAEIEQEAANLLQALS